MSLQSVCPRSPPTAYEALPPSACPTGGPSARDLIEQALIGVDVDRREQVRQWLEEKYYPTCAKCKGAKYTPAPYKHDTKPQVVDGVLSFVVPAETCHNCKGTGKEPDCTLCNNLGGNCWRCPRGTSCGGVSPL